MKLKEAINLANQRDGKPLAKFDDVYLPGYASSVKTQLRLARNRKR